LDDFRFGAIAVWGGLVARDQLEEALAEQRALRERGEDPPRIGEMLVEKGMLTPEELRLVLRVQLQRMPSEGHLLFGQIAAAKRLAPAGAVDRALDAQSREILAGRDVRRLGEVLVAAGDMRPADVEAVLAYQASRDSVPMAEARRQGLSDETPAHVPAGTGPLSASRQRQAGERPVFLPAGKSRFLLDRSIWIACLTAAAAALLVTLLRSFLFG